QLIGLRLQIEVEGPIEALRSATSVNADLLRRPDLGRVQAGCVADLLVLHGDPFRNPELLWSTAGQRTVIKNGVPVS
ncbi:MAG TPA: amidohydrolase family protein, partial [Pseudonocardiaceae bacterium]|nr:amidohydrolase family protein [Pseudonocardiaceae bacterium]